MISRLPLKNIAVVSCFIQICSYIITLTVGFFPILAATYVYVLVNIMFFLVLYRNNILLKELIGVISFILLFIIFTSLSSNEYSSKYEYILVGINVFLIGMLYKGYLAYRLTFYCNLIINILVFYIAFKSGFHPNFGGEIIYHGSRNIVNAYLIMGIIYYLFFCFTNNVKIKIPLIFLFTVNCILLQGRSGVALSILILIYSLYKNSTKIKIALLTIFTALTANSLVNYIINSTKFSQGYDTGRSGLFKEYFSGITFKDIFFGRSINECCAIIASFDANPHNSFIRGHMYHGLIHTTLFTFILLSVLRTKSLDLIFFLLILYIRLSFDTFGLFRTFDAVIFSIFIYSYYINKFGRPRSTA